MDEVNQPSNAHEIDDATLVDRLRAGDMQALGPLYARYGGAVRSLLVRTEPALGRSGAEDLGQEVFLTFLDTLERYQHEGRLRSWLYGIAVRKARGWRRRGWVRWALGRQHGEQAAGVSLHRDRTEERIEARRRVDQALASLPTGLREVIVLRRVEGLSARETARVLGISENAVNIRAHRALERLGEKS